MSVSTPYMHFADGPGKLVDDYQAAYHFFKVLPSPSTNRVNPFRREHVVDTNRDTYLYAFPKPYNVHPEQSFTTSCCDTRSATVIGGRRMAYDPTEEATHLRSDLLLRGRPSRSKTTKILFGLDTENSDFFKS